MPSKHKIWTIVCASLLVVAIVITAIFSMNTSTDFAEHNVISVKPFDADFNQKLSEARAKAAVDFLVNREGISESRLAYEGFGSTKLKNAEDPNSTENRRIEFIIIE